MFGCTKLVAQRNLHHNPCRKLHPMCQHTDSEFKRLNSNVTCDELWLLPAAGYNLCCRVKVRQNKRYFQSKKLNECCKRIVSCCFEFGRYREKGCSSHSKTTQRPVKRRCCQLYLFIINHYLYASKPPHPFWFAAQHLCCRGCDQTAATLDDICSGQRRDHWWDMCGTSDSGSNSKRVHFE